MVRSEGLLPLLLFVAAVAADGQSKTFLRSVGQNVRKTQYYGTGAAGFHPPTKSPVKASPLASPYEEELDGPTGSTSSLHMDEPRTDDDVDGDGDDETDAVEASETKSGDHDMSGSDPLDKDESMSGSNEEVSSGTSSLMMPGILPTVAEPVAGSQPTMAEQNLPTMTSMTAASSSIQQEKVGTDDEAENVDELLDEIDNLEQEVREKDDELQQTASLLSGKFSLHNITTNAQQQWKDQEWANKTPKEMAQMAEHEAVEMMEDKYVILVIIVMSIVATAFTLFVAQQMVENPQGCTAKICRCWVAIFRILCCPLRMLCCCCASSSSRTSPDDADRREHNRLSSGEFS